MRRKTGSHGPPWESISRVVLAPVCVTTLERGNESNTFNQQLEVNTAAIKQYNQNTTLIKEGQMKTTKGDDLSPAELLFQGRIHGVSWKGFPIRYNLWFWLRQVSNICDKPF